MVGVLEGAPKWVDTPWNRLSFNFTEDDLLKIERYCQKIHKNIEEDKMTPWERWRNTCEGQEIDRVQVLLAPLTIYVVRVLDGFADAIKPIDGFRQPKLFLEAYISFVSRFGIDYPDFYSLSYGESDWGSKAKLLEYAHPTIVDPIVKSMEDVDKLKVPDPRKSGIYPGYLWSIKKTKEFFKKHGLGDLVPVCASCCSPPLWIMSQSILGMKEGLLAPIRNPELAHRIVKLTTKFCIDYALSLREAGADIVWMCQHLAVWPPNVYKNFAKYDAEVAKKGKLDGWGFAFNQEKHIPILAEEGAFDTVKYAAFDPETPPEFARKFCTEHDIVYMCTEPDKTLIAGPQKIEEEVKKHIKIGTSQPKFAMHGGTIDYWTPPENLDFFVKCVKEYGKFPTKL